MTDARDHQKLLLRLYIVAGAPNSIAARANLARVLSDVDSADYVLEIVDCIAEPSRALTDGVLVTPTLLKLSPQPTRTVIGTLADQNQVREAIGLTASVPEPATNGARGR